MSRITEDPSINRLKTPEQQAEYAAKFNEQVVQLLNNGLTFGDNFDGKILNITFSAANSDTAQGHGLGRVPSGYLVLSRSASMVVYNGSAAWSSSNIVLRASAAGSISLLVF